MSEEKKPELDDSHNPVVNSDPESTPQEGVNKQGVAPDPAKVAEARRKGLVDNPDDDLNGPKPVK